MPKMKKSNRIAVRLNEAQLHNLDAYANANSCSRSQVLQRLADFISARVQIKLPHKAYQVKQLNKSIINSNAKIISSLDILYRKANANFKVSTIVNGNLVDIKKQLDQGNFGQYYSQALKLALILVKKRVKNNIANDHLVYLCLNTVEKELKLS